MIIGIDLGGTKLATALFSEEGKLLSNGVISLDGRGGEQVGQLITEQIKKIQGSDTQPRAIGVSIPGISHQKTGTVWAPNIPGWESYPLLDEIKKVSGTMPVSIDNDRACCMLGEMWRGNARGCKDAIYLSVGTGIGAGILIDGKILRGAHDIAGAVGWLALDKPFQQKYIQFGCFEYYASGDGIARLTRDILKNESGYNGVLKNISANSITAHHVFDAFENNDPIAIRVFDECIQYWGMAVANFISIFNPEKIIFGGGVFGPATRFIKDIQAEAAKWAQPISITQVSFEESGLHGDAA
ncbi:MAG: ROK family protein, partial [Cyclobacteriaceae bacterium]